MANLPVIILKGLVLLPQNEIRLEFDDEASKSLVDISEVFHENKILVVNAFNDKMNEIELSLLPKIAVLGTIKNKLVLPDGKTRVTIIGNNRINVSSYFYVDDIIEATTYDIDVDELNDELVYATYRKIKYELEKCIKTVPTISNSILPLLNNNNLSDMIDSILPYLPISKSRLCEYANCFDVIKRGEMIILDIYYETRIMEIEKEIESKVKKELDNNQKEYILKEKLKVIQEEIGECSLKEDEIKILKSKLSHLNAPKEIKNRIQKEINRYELMSDISPEISVVQNYIDWLLELPWNVVTNDVTDLKEISKNLDQSHFGLEEAKTRVIEYLAVKKNNPNVKSPVICLIGPPGVGKTTLASSIASAINRKFIKISVAGVNDESEIIGHRKSYVGASPGKIISGLRKVKTSNPVILIDEIDKMTKSYKGDPASALLEVLDSNQNNNFIDNYIEEAVDLSKVIFIMTANSLDSIPLALRDRLEIIKIDGYSELEKIDIAKKYLVPNGLKVHGIKAFKFHDDVIVSIIRNYTKESGVRELERSISKILRKVVTRIVRDQYNIENIHLTTKNLYKYLGNSKINRNHQNETQIGVVNGLACTSFGGNILPIEVNYYKGKGNLILTGSLGEVIKESANIALSYIKANYKKFNIRYEDLINNDIHIHIPSGAVAKEGPSAGVALTTSIISAFSNFKVSNEIAMTGEITLRGHILPVGGLKEKSIGAVTNNIKKMFVPYDNLDDLKIIPADIKDNIKYIPVKNYEDIYKEIRR